MKKIIASILILFLFLPIIAQGGGTPGSGTSSGGGGGGGGGGSKQTSIDNILKTLQDAKNQKNPKLDQLKKLLYIEPFVTKDYDKNISLALSVTGNGTLARNDKFVVIATVWNPNPIEIRRVMYLDLNVKEPGEKDFHKVNMNPVMITNNEYDIVGGKNASTRTFPELTSFSKLRTVGPVVFNLHVSDGQYSWNSEDYTVNLINRPPALENLTLQAPVRPRFNDRIIYLANVTDLDGDLVNITLHILDDKGNELKNATQEISPGKTVSFVANQYGFFDKVDSGKNFSYYYTFGDGIAVNNSTVQLGPQLRKSTSIWVGTPVVEPEDENQYWWQSYNFTIEMKNQESEEAPVQVSLFTDTKAHLWKAIKSQQVILTQQPQRVYFNVRPFDVLDANKTFNFRFQYSETDQHQQDHIDKIWSKPLNAKLVRYELISGLGLGNILALLLVSFLFSILMERRFYR